MENATKGRFSEVEFTTHGSVADVHVKGMKRAIEVPYHSGIDAMFQQDRYLYVLETDSNIEAMSLTAYYIDPDEVRYGEGEAVKSGEFFLDGDDQINDILGIGENYGNNKHWYDLTDRTIAKRLSTYVH